MKKLLTILFVSAACSASLWANSLSHEFLIFLDELKITIPKNNEAVNNVWMALDSFERNPTQEGLGQAKGAIGIACKALNITRYEIVTDGTDGAYDEYSRENVVDKFAWLMRRLDDRYQSKRQHR